MTSTLPVIRVGGVPEHFNYSWHLAQEQGLFAKHGVEAQWSDHPNGTGAMITAATNGEVDVIVALTEGLVSEIVKGSSLRLIGTYVSSPLRWGIITGKETDIHEVEHLKDRVFGISRFTSGSHLMVCVLAMERGWHPQLVKFDVQGNFKNLRDGVNSGKSSAFLWEYFTTKPYVDSGECRFVGSITTPWPCFMLAAPKHVVDTKLDALQKMLSALREACTLFHEIKGMSDIIATKYQLKPEDAKQWYKAVTVTASRGINQSALIRTLDTLYQAKVIAKKSDDINLEDIIDTRLAEIRADLRSIKLYRKPELLKFIRNNLAFRGWTSGKLSYSDLLPFDQHHYHGTDALDLCAKECGIEQDSNVLSLGAGFGGPARYFAGKLGAKVTAIEIQEDVHRLASELTERCGLSPLISHIQADAMEWIADPRRKEEKKAYGAIVSWLTLLHIPQRAQLIAQCLDLLEPGGVFFCEDFYQREMFTEGERKVLQDEVAAFNVMDLLTYKTAFYSAGFVVEKAEELSDDWMEFTKQRVATWEANKAGLIAVHREDTYLHLLDFYTKVRDLFAKGAHGHLGGVRFIVRKPLSQ